MGMCSGFETGLSIAGGAVCDFSLLSGGELALSEDTAPTV
jgi:hypothetical protein